MPFRLIEGRAFAPAALDPAVDETEADMTRHTLQSEVELLTYANAVRTRSRRGVGIVIITSFFVACAIVDAFASVPAVGL